MILTASCIFGVESILSSEIKKLGYEIHKVDNGRVSFIGDQVAIARCNIHLRTAGRIFINLGTYETNTFDELYDYVQKINWGSYIEKNHRIVVKVSSLKSTLTSVPACQSIIKKSIITSLLKKYDHLPEDGERLIVSVYILSNMATVFIDTTGTSLHKRGYRIRNYIAPLSETIAASLILLSYFRSGRVLLDPFCGSGTIPIEAAMIAKNIAPGGNRSFDAKHFSFIESSVWKQAYEEAYDLENNYEGITIYGSDINKNAIEMSKFHAKRANVNQFINFKVSDVKNVTNSNEYGIIICNPPYGERMLTEQETGLLYRDISSSFKTFDTWSKYIYTAYHNFEGVYGSRANKRRKIFNGKINCTYYQYFGPKPLTVNK
ncbi:MAG: class I SAM-dependent RNA methyltransferase [Clostridiales bacterium]|nr:class I SAM-dependent RNA methyltransferase [Clostridiales bacterium]